MQRRDLLSTIGTGALAASIPITASARRKRSHGVEGKIVQSDQMKALQHALSSQGHKIQTRDFERVDGPEREVYTAPISRSASTVHAALAETGVYMSAQIDDEYYIATPETVDKYPTGLIAFAATDDPDRVGESIQKDAPTPYNDGDDLLVKAQSHADDVLVGWNYKGTYDVEELCQILEPTGALAGGYSLLEGLEISSLSTLKRLFARVTIGGAVACYTEDIAEQVSQFIHDCPQDKYLYEVYMPKWWFYPKTPVIVAKCP